MNHMTAGLNTATQAQRRNEPTCDMTPREMTDIEKRMARLRDCLDALESNGSELLSKLKPVLLDSAPRPVEEVMPPKPVMTVLGSEIDLCADRVHSVSTRLHDILDRLGV